MLTPVLSHTVPTHASSLPLWTERKWNLGGRMASQAEYSVSTAKSCGQCGISAKMSRPVLSPLWTILIVISQLLIKMEAWRVVHMKCHWNHLQDFAIWLPWVYLIQLRHCVQPHTQDLSPNAYSVCPQVEGGLDGWDGMWWDGTPLLGWHYKRKMGQPLSALPWSHIKETTRKEPTFVLKFWYSGNTHLQI